MACIIKDILSNSAKYTQNYKWDIIENENNIVFPEDYKRFLEYYGTGSINGFLWVLSPICDNSYLNSFEQYKIMKKSYETMINRNLMDFKYRFYNSGIGLFPWGITDNGDELYWNYIKDGMEIVVFASRYADVFSYKMNMEEFLCGLLTKSIECSVLPADFVRDNNFFVSFTQC